MTTWPSITSFLDVPAACWVFDLDGTLSDHRERLARLMPEDPERSGAWQPYKGYQHISCKNAR